MLSNKEIRFASRQALKGKWGLLIAATLIYSLIAFVGGLIPIIGWIGIFICIGPLVTGLIWLGLRVSRSEEANLSYLFNGFNDFGRTFVAYLLIYIFTFLWSLLFVIPGIIKLYSYSQTFYILRDNPNISALDAITASREMMSGYKGKLFGLTISIAIWMLFPLAIFFISGIFGGFASAIFSNYYYSSSVFILIFSFIIMGLAFLIYLGLMIFLVPYLLVACAVFYDERQLLADEKAEEWPDSDPNSFFEDK